MVDNKKLGMMIAGFLLILVGITLMQSIADATNEATELGRTGNETITITTGGGTTAQDDTHTAFYFGNTTISTDTTGIEVGDEVNLTKNGTLSVAIANFTTGSYSIDYTYERDGYVVDSTARTLIDLIPLFFAITVLLLGVGIAMKSLEGILF